MKVLITGHRGFIGSHALTQLRDAGVHCVTQEWGEDMCGKLRNLDFVLHFGAISSTAETDTEKVLRQNYDFSVWLLNKCEDLRIPMQFSSSAAIYGLGSNFSEDAAPDPRTPYAWSKYLFERYVEQHEWSMSVQCFRYFNVYGDKGEEHKGDQASPHHKFKHQALDTGIIKVFEGSENYCRDFIHVNDVLKTQFQFFNVHQSGIWNIGNGIAQSFRQVADEIAEHYDAKVVEIPMPAHIKGYQTFTCADLSKLRGTLPI